MDNNLDHHGFWVPPKRTWMVTWSLFFPPHAQPSLIYKAAKLSACVAFAPVLIPYYITKTSINVALIPARAVYSAVTTETPYE